MAYQGEKKKGKINSIIKVLYVVIFLVLLLTVYFMFADDPKEQTKTKHTPTPIPTQAAEPVREKYLCIFLETDTENQTISFHEVTEGKTITLAYTGTTFVWDRFGVVIALSQLRYGEMYDVTYLPEQNKIEEIRGSQTIWEKNLLDGLEYDQENMRLRVGEINYRIPNGLFTVSDGVRISAEDILPMDQITIRGVDTYVYEIIVTRGHGYLALANADDFTDGTLLAGSYEFTIQKDVTYLLKEGTYQVVVSKGIYSGTKTIRIERDQTAIFDAEPFGRGKVQYADVLFVVEPLGAELYINGQKTSYYGQVLSLEYGTYRIEISLGGYDTYEESFVVNEPEMTKNIWLREQTTAEPEE